MMQPQRNISKKVIRVFAIIGLATYFLYAFDYAIAYIFQFVRDSNATYADSVANLGMNMLVWVFRFLLRICVFLFLMIGAKSKSRKIVDEIAALVILNLNFVSFCFRNDLFDVIFAEDIFAKQEGVIGFLAMDLCLAFIWEAVSVTLFIIGIVLSICRKKYGLPEDSASNDGVKGENDGK